ncbi:MAG TPA: PAS domain S-box protein [Patescibacteria group bacterium]
MLDEDILENLELINLSHDAIFIFDEYGKITYWNKGAENLYGWRSSEVIGKKATKILNTTFPKSFAKIKSILSKEKFWEGVLKHTTKNAREIFIKSRWTYIKSKNKRNILEINRDITETIESKLRLEKNEKKFRSMIENSSDVIIISDLNLKIKYVSPSVKKIFGYNPKKVIDLSVKDFVHPDDLSLLIKTHKGLVKNGIDITEEYKVRNSRGETRWIRAHSSNLLSDPNVEGIVTNFRDITNEKIYQQEIIDTQKELSAILKNVPVGVIVQNEDGDLVYVNKKAAEIAEYASVEEMMGAPRFDYIYKFEMRDEFDKKLSLNNLPGRVAIRTKKDVSVMLKFVSRKTKKVRWLIINSTITYQGQNNKPLLINMLQDVTEYKDADLRKNEFITMASHELKTPLTSLNVYMQFLLSNQKINNSKRGEYLLKAAGQVTKLQQLVSELLDQSTIQEGKLSLHLQETYIDFFINEIVNSFRETVRNFRFNIRGKTNSIVSIDKYRLEQVMANLLVNAVKYSNDRKEILVSLSKNKSFVLVSVRDFGIGVPQNEVKNIFKKYYRVIGKRENTFSGLGMGLYISEDIIKKHGGAISVKSTVGKGTKFTFTLPIV